MNIPITLFTTALCGFLLIGLAARVSLLRNRYKVSLGDGGIDPLQRAIRSHGNTAEQVPIFLLQCLCYELSIGSTRFLWIVASLFLLARVVFAIGLAQSSVNSSRRFGAGLGYLMQIFIAVALFAHWLKPFFN